MSVPPATAPLEGETALNTSGEWYVKLKALSENWRPVTETRTLRAPGAAAAGARQWTVSPDAPE